MPRKPTPRSASEHVSVLSKMAQQVDVDTKLAFKKRAKISKHISELIKEFSQEIK